ncbi:MAG: hypothetical protein ACLP01_32360 [Solirubrobacteraceae bacterium]
MGVEDLRRSLVHRRRLVRAAGDQDDPLLAHARLGILGYVDAVSWQVE